MPDDSLDLLRVEFLRKLAEVDARHELKIRQLENSRGSTSILSDVD